MPQSNTELAAPSVLRRFAAIFYDALLLLGVILSTVIIVPATLTIAGIQTSVSEGDVVHDVEPILEGWILQLYFVLILVSFFCWFWHRNGQTLGMQAWRIRVDNLEGNRLSLGQCVIRLVVATLSFACLGAGYWWCWIDKDGMSWHDRVSKSRLVLIPKKTK